MRRLVGDPPLFAIALALSLYGLSIVYSAGQTDVPTVATHPATGVKSRSRAASSTANAPAITPMCTSATGSKKK